MDFCQKFGFNSVVLIACGLWTILIVILFKMNIHETSISQALAQDEVKSIGSAVYAQRHDSQNHTLSTEQVVRDRTGEGPTLPRGKLDHTMHQIVRDSIEERKRREHILSSLINGTATETFYRQKLLPQTYTGSDPYVFPCVNKTLLGSNSDFLLTAEEVPMVPGLKNPCFCAEDFARIEPGVGLTR